MFGLTLANATRVSEYVIIRGTMPLQLEHYLTLLLELLNLLFQSLTICMSNLSGYMSLSAPKWVGSPSKDPLGMNTQVRNGRTYPLRAHRASLLGLVNCRSICYVELQRVQVRFRSKMGIDHQAKSHCPMETRLNNGCASLPKGLSGISFKAIKSKSSLESPYFLVKNMYGP